jgi:hypothetical protein
VGAGPDLNLVTNHGTITVRKAGQDDEKPAPPATKVKSDESKVSRLSELAFLR